MKRGGWGEGGENVLDEGMGKGREVGWLEQNKG